MAKEHISIESTGIFRTVKRNIFWGTAAEIESSQEEIQSLFARLQSGERLEDELSEIERHATIVIEKTATNELGVFRSKMEELRNADAHEVLSQVESVRALVEKGDIKGASLYGIYLGMTYLRMSVRWAEPAVRHDKKRSESAKTKRQAMARNRIQQVRYAFDHIPTDVRAKGRMAIYRHIARLSLGTSWKCSPRTVRAILDSGNG